MPILPTLILFLRTKNKSITMFLPPLLDPAKLFFHIDPENLEEVHIAKLSEILSLPGKLEFRADNVHFLIYLLNDCASIDTERYLNKVFLPWVNLKQRTSVHRERVLDEFSRIGEFQDRSKEYLAHLVNIYRSIVSDLFDPYLSLLVASYQFKDGSFTNINNANISQGERNKVEFIAARDGFSKLLHGYDGRVRNAISHSGSHGITYKENEVIFREISRSPTPRVNTVTWSVDELEEKIVDLFECIISIDAAENIFGIDCINLITENTNILLQFTDKVLDRSRRQKISATLDEVPAHVRGDTSLSMDEKLQQLAPFLFLNCGKRQMPVTSISLATSRESLFINIPIAEEISSDEALIARASKMLRYAILGQTIFKNLFSEYIVREQDSDSKLSRLTVITGEILLNDYCEEAAGLVDLLNSSKFFDGKSPFSVGVDFAALHDIEMASLDEPFPRYKR